MVIATQKTYEGPDIQLPPPTQPHRASQFPPPGYSQPLTQPPHIAAAPGSQDRSASTRALRSSRRSARAYDPTRGQRTGRPREGGRGRTPGAPNYKLKEVETLLDIVEEELPIASKGWRVVGSRFRDWATVAEYPARTDRSLELKFKQVCILHLTLRGTY